MARAPTVVCLHGLRRTPADWDGVRPGLAPFGQVRAPAIPARPREALAAMTADAVGPEDIVIGHSMGGVVALSLAAERPLRALVLTGCFFPPARNGRSLPRSVADYAGHRLAFVRAAGTPGGAVRARGGARALGSLAGGVLRTPRRAPAPVLAGTPVLVVHARDDHHVPVDFALAAVAAHPGWASAVLVRGGHHAHVDTPDAWLAAVVPWLTANS